MHVGYLIAPERGLGMRAHLVRLLSIFAVFCTSTLNAGTYIEGNKKTNEGSFFVKKYISTTNFREEVYQGSRLKNLTVVTKNNSFVCDTLE
jgi:hypothetical protein